MKPQIRLQYRYPEALDPVPEGAERVKNATVWNNLEPGPNGELIIPENAPEGGEFYIEIWESGGAESKERGKAVIVSGLDGGPLVPLYIKGKNPEPNGEHARFLIKEAFVVTLEREGDEAKVQIYHFHLTDRELRHRIIWEGTLTGERKIRDELPKALENLIDAVKAAYRKSRIVNCTSPVFYRAVQQRRH